MTSLDHPYTLAGELARLLEKDLVATRLIKEHIQPERLREILDIDEPEPRMTETIEEALLSCNAHSEELLDYVSRYFSPGEVLRQYDDSRLLSYVVARFGKAELLKAIADAA